MDFGPEIAEVIGGILAKPKHTGEGGDAQMLDGLAKIERGGHIGQSFGAGPQLELIGPRDAGTIEQRIKRELGGMGAGLFEPERREMRKLLRQAVNTAIHRQSPAGKSHRPGPCASERK